MAKRTYTVKLKLDEWGDGWQWEVQHQNRVVDRGWTNTRWGARRQAERLARRHAKGWRPRPPKPDEYELTIVDPGEVVTL